MTPEVGQAMALITAEDLLSRAEALDAAASTLAERARCVQHDDERTQAFVLATLGDKQRAARERAEALRLRAATLYRRRPLLDRPAAPWYDAPLLGIEL